jgi:hypothetical protein
VVEHQRRKSGHVFRPDGITLACELVEFVERGYDQIILPIDLLYALGFDDRFAATV